MQVIVDMHSLASSPRNLIVGSHTHRDVRPCIGMACMQGVPGGKSIRHPIFGSGVRTTYLTSTSVKCAQSGVFQTSRVRVWINWRFLESRMRWRNLMEGMRPVMVSAQKGPQLLKSVLEQKGCSSSSDHMIRLPLALM